MPNLVHNILTIEGPTTDLVAFIAQAGRPHSYGDPEAPTQNRALSLWNFVRPEGPLTTAPDGWTISNWGSDRDIIRSTRSDATKTTGIDYASVEYCFQTAWAPAEIAYRRMVGQYPSLTFSFHCEEEQGWGIEFAGAKGKLIVTDEWGIAESHAEWHALGQECRLCEANDDGFRYDDCPTGEE